MGSLFDPKIKSFTPSQPPPASRGRSEVAHSLSLQLCSLPCLQGRVGVGSLFDPKIKSFTPSQPPPASRGRSEVAHSLSLQLCSLPCLQGRVGVGSLFDPKIKSFTPSQPPPASRGRSKLSSHTGVSKIRSFFARHSCGGRNPVLLLMGPLGYSLRSPLRGRSSSVLRAFRLSCLRRDDEPGTGYSRQPRLTVQARQAESKQYWSIRQFVRVVRAVAGEVLPQ